MLLSRHEGICMRFQMELYGQIIFYEAKDGKK
jgi:hypothetical protein